MAGTVQVVFADKQIFGVCALSLNRGKAKAAAGEGYGRLVKVFISRRDKFLIFLPDLSFFDQVIQRSIYGLAGGVGQAQFSHDGRCRQRVFLVG